MGNEASDFILSSEEQPMQNYEVRSPNVADAPRLMMKGTELHVRAK